jgi:hypothetical protein
MLLATQEIHRRAADLGKALGFVVTREVSDSLLRLRLDGTYRPRIDLLWSLALDDQKRQALAWVLERELTDVTHLPVVGVEVEGTTPTTKTMGADVANLAALGVPLGLLVVSEEGEKNIYRRAARAIRSVRRSFGDLRLLPLEAGWLDLLLQREWPVGLSSVAVPKRARPAGGETLAWSAATRDRLRSLGEKAGFVVAEPYTPPVLDAAFDLICRQRAKPPVHTCDPLAGTVRTMTKAGDLFTGCKIDLTWLMPLPHLVHRARPLAVSPELVADSARGLENRGVEAREVSACLQELVELQAAHIPPKAVLDEQIDRLPPENSQGLVTVVGPGAVVADRAQDLAQEPGQVRLIVQDQDACHTRVPSRTAARPPHGRVNDAPVRGAPGSRRTRCRDARGRHLAWVGCLREPCRL